jgi:hypothetical protein
MAYDSRIADPQTGRYQRLTPRGAALSAELVRLTGPDWGPGTTIDSNFWTIFNNGAGSGVALSGGVVTLTSGTANNGEGNFTSVRKARYVTTLTNYYHACANLSATGGANTTRIFGPFTYAAAPAVQDGFYFSYNGTTSTLSVNAVNAGGAATSVASGSFNGEVTSYTLDANMHVFDIMYNMSAVYFIIDNVLIHKMAPTTAPLSSTMTLQCSAACFNSASGTVSAGLVIWENTIMRCGSTTCRPQSAYIFSGGNGNVLLKRGAGTLQRLVLNNPGTNTNTLSIYDGLDATGTLKAVITNVSTSGAVGAFTEFNMDFYTGLFMVAATGTASVWTVIYD